jgi:hypothetical protein
MQGLAFLLCLALLLCGQADMLDSSCPDNEQGSRVRAAAEQGRSEGGTPYLFQKHQLSGRCPVEEYPQGGCPAPVSWYWYNFCTFDRDVGGGWAAYMICDDARQKSIVDYLRGKGVADFAELLTFSPCDLWPLIRYVASHSCTFLRITE